MAVDFFAQAASGAIQNGWVTIVASEGDDLYIQRVASKDGALLIADNASFLDATAISDFDTFSDVFVTNAARIDVLDQESDGYPLLPYPAIAGTASNHTFFVLETPADDVDNENDPVTGIISNGVGGQWSFTAPAGLSNVWNFNSPGDPNDVTLVDLLPGGGPSVGPLPVRARLLQRGPSLGLTITVDELDETSCLDVEWDSSVIGPGGFSAETPPRLDSISFDRLTNLGGFAPTTYTNILASSAAVSLFTLPVGAGGAFGEVVAGSLSGVFSIDVGNNQKVQFQFTTETQNPDPALPAGLVPLVFRTIDANGLVSGAYSKTATFATPVVQALRKMTGSVNLETGVISVLTESNDKTAGGTREVGPIALDSASFARFDHSVLGGDFTLFPGQNFVPSLTVDLLSPGATASIKSPVVDAAFVDLRAGNVVIDARVSASTSITIEDSQAAVPVDPATALNATFSVVDATNAVTAGGNTLLFADLPATVVDGLAAGVRLLVSPSDGSSAGSRFIRRVTAVRVSGTDTFVTLATPIDFTATQGLMYFVADETGAGRIAKTVAEQAFFNAAVAAKVYDIRLDDDIQTSAVKRSKLFVSTTGSLAGSLPSAAGVIDTPANTVFALVKTGDILVEGTINASQHSYMLQSPQEGTDGVDHRAPYYFSTESLVSGANTGLIKGGTAAITLGNDVPTFYDNVDNGGSTAFNVVTLQTELQNLRVRASDQRGSSLQTPFPYDLKVEEADDLVIDAVAASSLPIFIAANKGIDFRASLASASDVSVTAGSDLALNAPLSTAFGSIVLTGRSLAISNSVRVLDGFSDDLRTDIELTATDGDIKLAGAVSAVNTVALNQQNTLKAALGGSISGSARVVADVVTFNSSGRVAFGTDARVVSGQANGDASLNDADAVYVDVTAYGNVVLTAAGNDVEMQDSNFGWHLDRTDTVSAAVTARAAPTEFALPANFAGLRSLSVGMGLLSVAVDQDDPSVAATIAAIGPADSDGVVVVTIVDGGVNVGDGEAFDVQFGNYANFSNGLSTVSLPLGVNIAQLYVSQGVVSDLLPEGTRISEIDVVNRTLTFSSAATADGLALLRFVEPIALWGTVRGASSLVASAPKGSVDLYVPTSDTVVLGNKSALALNKAEAVGAAGTVTIRSLAGSVDVLDAPLAGSTATEVRVAATSHIGNTPVYSRQTPGTFPGTLANNQNGRLVVDGVSPAVRDRVLLTAQDDPLHNGVYIVVATGGAAAPWRLSRLAGFDTTAGMSLNARFRVTDGANIDKIFAVTRYDNTLGSTPVSVTAVPNRYGAFPVSAVSTLVLSGAAYDSTEHAIQSVAPAALSATAFDGVQLKENDYVLVRFGIDDPNVKTAANGVYRVDSVGGTATAWKLVRVSQGDVNISAGGVVVVNNGTLRSRVTGNGFRVAYDSLGWADMTVADVTSSVTTEIGSDNYNAFVNYVVSSNGGTNSAAGSLGKTLLMAQQNIAVDPIDPAKPQQTKFQFGNNVGSIVLTQQLPAITRALTIDGSASRYTIGTGAGPVIGIDGSRITRLRNGRAPGATDQINGFEVRGAAASGSRLSSLRAFGFNRGAAVRVDAAGQEMSGVVVDNMTVGLDLAGRRAPNAVGIQVAGNVGGYSTLSRNIVVSSTGAGIRIGGGTDADGVRLVGNQVGRIGLENVVGIDVVTGATRTDRIGLEAAGVPVTRVPATRVSDTVIRLAETFTGWSGLYVGMGVTSGLALVDIDPLAAAATIASIDAVARTVTITGGRFASNISTPLVDFGVFANFTSGEKVIALPTGLISVDNLYLGQPVTSSSVLPASTVITAIDRANNTITLSNAATRTSTAAVTFAAPGRNAVSYNIRGITLGGGTTQVVGTDVFNSVLDGITVTGGTPRIGAVGTVGTGGRTTAKDITASSNAIYANGGVGILVAANVAASDVTIQGNRLGADTAGRTLQTNRRGNILFAGLAAAAQPSISAAFSVSGSTVTVTMPGHGLPSGYKVYVAGSSGLVGGTVKVGAYVITRIDADSFTFTRPSSGFTATRGFLRFEKFGSATSLKVTDNRDLEGNLHGLAVAQPNDPFNDPRPPNQGIVPPGRPVAPPRRR